MGSVSAVGTLRTVGMYWRGCMMIGEGSSRSLHVHSSDSMVGSAPSACDVLVSRGSLKYIESHL